MIQDSGRSPNSMHVDRGGGRHSTGRESISVTLYGSNEACGSDEERGDGTEIGDGDRLPDEYGGRGDKRMGVREPGRRDGSKSE